jgi:hypothetical protein
MRKIKGRYSPDNHGTIPGEWTAEEITALLKDHHTGMIQCTCFYMNGERCEPIFSANFAIGHDTFVYDRDGKLLIPTWFRKSDDTKVQEDVIIEFDDIEDLLLVNRKKRRKNHE